MRRRQFITLLGAVASWPLAAQAQRSKTFRVGILANEKWPPLDGLRDGLRSLGYVEGQNLELVNRYVEGEPEAHGRLRLADVQVGAAHLDVGRGIGLQL